MNVFDIELYSIIVLLALMLDYYTKFKNNFNESSFMWLIITISVFFVSILNIVISVTTFFSNDTKVLFLLIAYAISLTPSLGLFYYIRIKFLNKSFYLKDKYITILIYFIGYFLVLFSFYVDGLFKNVPTHLTSSFEYTRFLLITLLPSIILICDFINELIKRKKINIKVFIIPILCIVGIVIDVFSNSITFLTAAYTISALILYLCKFDSVMHIDPLTGLYNRAFLSKITFRRKDDDNSIVYMIDIDKFKYINDTYGHLIGDKVLIDVGLILKKSVRESDVVIRYGGDEFVIIASVKLAKDIDKIPLKIVKNLEEYNNINKIKLSLSIGAEPVNGRCFEEIIKLSDVKMYKNKKKNHKKLK